MLTKTLYASTKSAKQAAQHNFTPQFQRYKEKYGKKTYFHLGIWCIWNGRNVHVDSNITVCSLLHIVSHSITLHIYNLQIPGYD